jgi:hypothetical protein
VGGRTSGRTFWLATVFSCARLGRFALAPAVGSVDAASNRRALPVTSANGGLCRHSTATVRVGNLHRAGFYQFLPVFSGDLVALLPAAGTPPFAARRGKRRRSALPRFRNFFGSDWKTIGPLDPRGSLPDFGAQRLDAVRSLRHRYLSRDHGSGVRSPLHSDAHFNRGVSGNHHLQQLGDLADAGWTPNGRTVDRRAEFRRQSRRRRRPRTNRIYSGQNRFLLLAILYHRGRGLDWRAQLVVRGRPSGRNKLGQGTRPALPNQCHSRSRCGASVIHS